MYKIEKQQTAESMYQYHILIHSQLEVSTVANIYFGSCMVSVNGTPTQLAIDGNFRRYQLYQV
jgi:hypothetical protein